MVRLGFSVAAHLRCETLIVDEVLAVGDADFQRKCIGKMKAVGQDGRTILFVSHNMQSVSTLTDKAVLIESGRVGFIGETRDCIQRYLNQNDSNVLDFVAPNDRDVPKIVRVKINTSEPANIHRFGRQLEVMVDIDAPEQIRNASLSFQILDSYGNPVTHTWIFDSSKPWGRSKGVHKLRCVIKEPLIYMGRYSLRFFLSESEGGKKFDFLESVCPFEVVMHGHQREFKWQPGTAVYLEQAEWHIDSELESLEKTSK